MTPRTTDEAPPSKLPDFYANILAWSSDVYHHDGDDVWRAMETMRACDLPDSYQEKFLGGNARALYNIEPPAEFITDGGIDVRPHPHIGLGTVTYLYQGEFEHRDSLGTHQMIYPGEVNWMLAGRGVTHSERTSAETRAKRHKLFGIQTWVALPEDREDVAPDFEHHKAGALPELGEGGAQARLILGTAWGERSPVTMQSEIFYADVTLAPGSQFPLPDDHEDRGIYVTQGSIELRGGSDDGVPPRRPPFRAGRSAGGAADGAWRRDAERPALCLVELRLLLARSDRRSEGSLKSR